MTGSVTGDDLVRGAQLRTLDEATRTLSLGKILEAGGFPAGGVEPNDLLTQLVEAVGVAKIAADNTRTVRVKVTFTVGYNGLSTVIKMTRPYERFGLEMEVAGKNVGGKGRLTAVEFDLTGPVDTVTRVLEEMEKANKNTYDFKEMYVKRDTHKQREPK